MVNPRFIVLEGVDGSGKTTQASRVAQWLRSQGRSVFECFDGRTGVWGEAARDFLERIKPNPARGHWPLDGVRSDAEYLCACFVKSRRELSTQIESALHLGKDVVCDRWEPSTWAYNIADGVPTSHVLHWIRRHPPVVQPNLILWLRLSPGEALERVQADVRAGTRARSTRFETVEFLEEVTSSYEGMPGLVRVDASQPLEDVTDELVEHIAYMMQPNAFM